MLPGLLRFARNDAWARGAKTRRFAHPTTQQRTSMTLPVILLLAGLRGAGGGVLAAADAHAAPGAGLAAAAYLLLFHAAALLGGAALHAQGVLSRPLLFVVLVAWIVGAVLFSGDVALRAFAGHRLFPMAAPAGGVILIAAWLGLAATAVAALFAR